MKLNLTDKEAQFLLCAATELDTTKSAYKNIPDIARLQHTICETLRNICWESHNAERKEKENARLQIENARKRWPDILKKLTEKENNHSI